MTPSGVLVLWPLFREGLENIVRLTREEITEDEYCKMLINLAARDDAWLGVVYEGPIPMSYACAVDSTPPHTKKKTFTVTSFYAMPDCPDATQALMLSFEEWARQQGVHSYVVTTRRVTGAAIKCFSSGRYGFQQSYRAFEKIL